MMQNILLSALLLTMTTITMTAQTARWITVDDSLRNEPNTWMEFRKDFTLKRKPKTAEMRIAADSKYWLWVNVNVSERALREIYLEPFRRAVSKAHVWSIMGSYNMYKGVHCCHNDELINGNANAILKILQIETFQ